MKRLAIALAISSSLALPFAAHAVEYNQVQTDKSAINFTYKQMGVAVDGKFSRFSSQFNFDPAKPTAAKASFDVELASVDTGASEGDEEVAGKPWFNTKVFGNRYEVAGQLSIKGKTQDVVVPATFTAQGKSGVFDGSFTIRRADFSIGEGSWAKFDIVANDVLIKFRITAASK